MRFVSTLLAALVSVVSLAAQAQDPPNRVGRLAHTEGAVSIYMDPDIGWEPGYMNTPITSENSVWTDVDARAEVRVGGMALRLDETTQLDVVELDDNTVQAMLVRGALNVRIRHFYPEDRVAIDTPQARFVLQAAGRYRIDADPERGDSRLTVFAGRAALESGRGRVVVSAGNSVVVWGERAAYAMQRTIVTPFDRWANARDERWIERRAPQYVSTYMTGYEDLDQYGEWIVEPDYGPLWIPTRVARDWVPYRYGHWAWVRPWGWTWIDDQPWGYAPFHYGRWVQVRDRWAWYPGKRVERPVWAPALVAWVGGSNWNIGVRSGSAPVVGWYPLSPFERYQPWYRANPRDVTNINLNFTFTDRDRAYRYADRQRDYNRLQAATVVQRDTLLTRRSVSQSMVQVAPEQLRQQQVTQQPSTVLPSRTDAVRARRAPETATASAPPSAASTARPGSPAPQPASPGAQATARQGTPGVAPAAPVMPPPVQRPAFAREQRAPAPQAAPSGAKPPPPEAVTRAVPPGQSQSRFGPGAQPPAPGMPPSAKGQEAIERRDTRAAERDQEKAAREAQQQQQRAQEQARQQQDQARQQQEQAQRAQQEQQRAQQEQQRQQQERAARDAQQRQQQDQARQQQEQAQRAQQEQQRAQQEQQRQQQERAGRDAQQRQQQEQAQRAQQEQQRAQQEQRQQQERAARDAQQRQQQDQARQQQEQAQRAQQEQARQQQERAARDAQQRQQQEQAQRQQQEQAQRAQQEQQRQQQERAAREAQQRAPAAPQAQPQQPPQAQPPQPPQAQQPPARGRDGKTDEEREKEKEKEKEEREKGKGRGR